ncbi:MAG: hypothetical protein Q8N39_08415 [Pelolinea sp.]|nr:hypothetical protein [Pelolinea sp.]
MLIATTSVWQPFDEAEQIRTYTRPYEFDYFGWTANAVWQKLSSISLGPIRHLSYLQQRKIIKDYFQALADTQNLKNSLETMYANPESSLKKNESSVLERKLQEQETRLEKLSILAEAVIQDQIGQTLDAMGLIELKQPLPPVLYHVTDLPKDLIISPRNVIRQEKSVSLQSYLSPSEEIALESKVEENTDYSALVVPVGGVSTYPTMVINTGNLLYLVDTVAHEWTHNLLIFRPLGWNYSTTPALRTMNETTASIAGEEISWFLIRRFYGDLLNPEDNFSYRTYEAKYIPTALKTQAEFDFRQEMYQTRIIVDDLLAQNKIKEAEQFMEARRKVFWENGYQIRKLNQAYFAFYGAYANEPFSAAGADPVGNDVRTLRARSRNLLSFIQKISWISSYDQLKEAVNAY